MASRLHCSLASVVKKRDLDELRKPRNYGEPMSQGSNWNLIDRYGESLHFSEVVRARELKFCEGCGVLLVRLRGSKEQFYPDCERPKAIAMGSMQ
jgi:hypothetical protein